MKQGEMSFEVIYMLREILIAKKIKIILRSMIYF